MTDLLERLQAADSRYAAVALFQEVAHLLGDECPEDFKNHTNLAYTSVSDTRAWGYLLLAAMTLVPEGWVIRKISTDIHVDHQDCPAHAELGETPWAHVSDDKITEGHAATPALALTIAALRARESAQPEEHTDGE